MPSIRLFIDEASYGVVAIVCSIGIGSILVMSILAFLGQRLIALVAAQLCVVAMNSRTSNAKHSAELRVWHRHLQVWRLRSRTFGAAAQQWIGSVQNVGASPRVSQFLRRSVAEALGREVEVALVSLGGKSSEAHHRRIALARDVLDVLRDATVSRRHRFEQEADRQVFEALGGIRRGANGGAEDGQ